MAKIETGQDKEGVIVSEKIVKKEVRGRDHCDFNIPFRPFFKKYINKDWSGQKKFTLVLAYSTKGDLNKVEKASEIEKIWNKVKTIMGGDDFQRVFGTRAKEQDWADSPKKGLFQLRPGWGGIF